MTLQIDHHAENIEKTGVQLLVLNVLISIPVGIWGVMVSVIPLLFPTFPNDEDAMSEEIYVLIASVVKSLFAIYVPVMMFCFCGSIRTAVAELCCCRPAKKN